MLTNTLIMLLNLLGVPDSTASLMTCQTEVERIEQSTDWPPTWREGLTKCMAEQGFVPTDEPYRAFKSDNAFLAVLDGFRIALTD